MQELLQQIRSEIRGIWRYRWRAIIVAWVVCALGWFFIYTMPNIYEARAQVFVDADSRLVEVMSQVGVAPGVGAAVFIVRQAMLGRPQLERVARDTGLDKRAATEEDYDSLILGLKEKIDIDSGRASIGKNLYSISYMDRDRDMAISVVSTLLDAFVSDVLAMNDQGSNQATGYLDDQLTYYSELLSVAEQQLAEFKKKNIGLLPGESGGIFERLQVEMDLLKQLQLDLSIETDLRKELRSQINSEAPFLPDGTSIIAPASGVLTSPTETTIRDLESTRSQLLLSYTDRHPDVIAVAEQLQQLYEIRSRELAARSRSDGTEGVINANNPIYQNIQIALNQSSATIAAARSEVAQHEAIVRELSGQINTIPDVEAEYAQLNRNYDQYRSLYAELLVQSERERMGSAGSDRDVVNFNVIEPPAAALEPVAPKRSFFLFFVLFLGLGIGGAVGYLKHITNPIFADAQSLRKFSGLPILGVVSAIGAEQGLVARSLNTATFSLVAALLVISGAVVIAFQDAGVTAVHSLMASGL